MDKKKRKEILDKLKNTNRIYDEDYNDLDKDLEQDLENEYLKKKDRLKTLLFERELLKLRIDKRIK